jgi:hypothetical protein
VGGGVKFVTNTPAGTVTGKGLEIGVAVGSAVGQGACVNHGNGVGQGAEKVVTETIWIVGYGKTTVGKMIGVAVPGGVAQFKTVTLRLEAVPGSGVAVGIGVSVGLGVFVGVAGT